MIQLPDGTECHVLHEDRLRLHGGLSLNWQRYHVVVCLPETPPFVLLTDHRSAVAARSAVSACSCWQELTIELEATGIVPAVRKEDGSFVVVRHSPS